MWRHAAQSRSAAEVASRSTAARQLASSVRRAVGCQERPDSFSRDSNNASFRTCHRRLSSTPLASTLDHSDMPPEGSSVSNHSGLPVSQRTAMKSLFNTLQVTSALTRSWAPQEMEFSVKELQNPWADPFDNELHILRTDHAVSMEESTDDQDLQCPIPDPADREEQEVDVSIHSQKTESTDVSIDLERRKPRLPIPTLVTRLTRALKAKNLDQVVAIFNQSVEEDFDLDSKLLLRLFQFLVTKDALTSYNVLRRYRQLENRPAEAKLYAKLCRALGNEHYVRKGYRFKHAVKALKDELDGLGVETYQHLCFPSLTLSLVRLKNPSLSRAARRIYDYMVKQNFPLSAQMVDRYLASSKYSRQQDLPYSEILRDAVAWGFRPYPRNAINVLQNLFPFTNVEATSLALGALLELQSTGQSSGKHRSYPVDIGMLEQITAAGARKASPELNLMVWDFLELLGYQPTEAMYENTVQAFCMSYRQDHSAFSVLAEMESNGYEPSRALIRSMSRSLRFSTGRTDHAYYMLTQGENKAVQVSVASLNAVLSACAELGDVDRAFASFADFEEYGLKPNADSFSYLLESLAFEWPEKIQHDEVTTEHDIASRVEAAESVLVMMKEEGFPVSNHSLHAYISLLCNAGGVDTAVRAVGGALETNQHVANKTLFVLAEKCGSEGRIELARDLASKITDRWQFLEKRIDRWERKFRSQRQSAPDDP